ncbi:MAG: GNAT family N-acetyltransferase [Phreatobacter sp.]|uniref:GNAT family N-acetyltransferase n=1 Tax=Phreatobacter sp. TaxID=1966341 RepID=UPI004036FAEA
MARAFNALGTIRELTGSDAALHREHLLRLDPQGRRERFNGVADDRFVTAYSARCFAGRTRVFAWVDLGGAVRGSAELHPPTAGEPADIAFSVEPEFRNQGIGSRLFEAVMAAARYSRFPELRITSTAGNRAMRALARKFGARFTAEAGEVTGLIPMTSEPALAEPRQHASGTTLVVAV